MKSALSSVIIGLFVATATAQPGGGGSSGGGSSPTPRPTNKPNPTRSPTSPTEAATPTFAPQVPPTFKPTEAAPLPSQNPTPAPTEPSSNKPYVRREIRKWSKEEIDKLVNAFWIMKTTSTTEGQELYGPNFHNHDEILFLHSCSTMDPRCDQGHYGPQFMTFHRAMLLKYERSIKAVDPSIEGMPYWDMTKDSTTGEFRNDPNNYIWTDNYFGDYYGDPEDGYIVKNGLLAYWPIAEYTQEKFGSTSPIAEGNVCVQEEDFKGTVASICERCCNVEDCTCGDDDTYKHWLRAHDDCTPYVVRKPQEMLAFGGTLEVVYTEKNFDDCTDLANVKSWMQWQNCIEVSTFQCTTNTKLDHLKSPQKAPLQATLPEEIEMSQLNSGKITEMSVSPASGADREKGSQFALDQLKQLMDENFQFKKANGQTTDSLDSQECAIMYDGYFDGPNGREYPPAFHSQVHVKLGMNSELQDVTTSPNEAIVFTTYHNNVDRSNFHWSMNMYNEGRDNGATYGYPDDPDSYDENEKAPYGTSGPYALYDLLACEADKNTYYDYNYGDRAWIKGTTLDEVLLSRFPFKDLFECGDDEDCSGGEDGYTHRDILYWTSPERTPYTYDTLEHLYEDKDQQGALLTMSVFPSDDTTARITSRSAADATLEIDTKQFPELPPYNGNFCPPPEFLALLTPIFDVFDAGMIPTACRKNADGSYSIDAQNVMPPGLNYIAIQSILNALDQAMADPFIQQAVVSILNTIATAIGAPANFVGMVPQGRASSGNIADIGVPPTPGPPTPTVPPTEMPVPPTPSPPTPSPPTQSPGQLQGSCYARCGLRGSEIGVTASSKMAPPPALPFMAPAIGAALATDSAEADGRQFYPSYGGGYGRVPVYGGFPVYGGSPMYGSPYYGPGYGPSYGPGYGNQYGNPFAFGYQNCSCDSLCSVRPGGNACCRDVEICRNQ